jgi:hypothetical protein
VRCPRQPRAQPGTRLARARHTAPRHATCLQGLKADRNREALQYYQYNADHGNVEMQTIMGQVHAAAAAAAFPSQHRARCAGAVCMREGRGGEGKGRDGRQGRGVGGHRRPGQQPALSTGALA